MAIWFRYDKILPSVKNKQNRINMTVFEQQIDDSESDWESDFSSLKSASAVGIPLCYSSFHLHIYDVVLERTT